MGNMAKLMISTSIVPLLHFVYYEVIRNNSVWNTIMGDKEFCKSTDGRSIVCMEDNPCPE